MILEEHLPDLESRFTDGPFLRPDYRGYNFMQIPALVDALFGIGDAACPFGPEVLPRVVERPRNVVLLMIDGFGYNHWLRYGEGYPFLRSMLSQGSLMPITAVFPSTTSASVTAIGSGLTPQQHGLMEWHLYLEELDQVIVTLPFKSLGRGIPPEELAARGVDPHLLFNGESHATRLRRQGVVPHSFLGRGYAGGAFTSLIHAGAEVHAYGSPAELIVMLREALALSSEPSYFYVYWDGMDVISHRYEPHSAYFDAELNSLTHLLQTELLERVDSRVAESTVLLVTSDHGHVPVNPAETVYLNAFPEIESALAVSSNGRRIHPWGSARDLFLQVDPLRLKDTVAALRHRLHGIADVRLSQNEADRRLFGFGEEHPRFRSRIGNVLILPYEHRTVSYQYPGLEKTGLRGMHGGMSREEMLTVLGFATLSELM